MLPFLKRKQEGSMSADDDHVLRKPDEGSEEYDTMHAVAEDLLKAIEAKDVPGIAAAFRAGFELADSEPHEEGEHV